MCREIYFKELAHVVVEAVSLKSVGQDSRLGMPAVLTLLSGNSLGTEFFPL
jgi:hypothetical protein